MVVKILFTSNVFLALPSPELQGRLYVSLVCHAISDKYHPCVFSYRQIKLDNQMF